jgi:hypothetical protein
MGWARRAGGIEQVSVDCATDLELKANEMQTTARRRELRIASEQVFYRKDRSTAIKNQASGQWAAGTAETSIKAFFW